MELARGVAHYFRTRCNSSFAWPRTGGNQITLPTNAAGETRFPPIAGVETKYRTVECVRILAGNPSFLPSFPRPP